MAGDIEQVTGGWRGAEPGAAGDGREGEPRATGEPRVDAALARLDELAGLPVTEHTRVFDDVHRRLEDVLGELGTGPAAEAPS